MNKKTKMFAGDPAPFVMELPPYHVPSLTNVLRGTWERGWSFIKRAGSVIVLSSIVIWTLNSLSFEGGLHYLGEEGELTLDQLVKQKLGDVEPTEGTELQIEAMRVRIEAMIGVRIATVSLAPVV